MAAISLSALLTLSLIWMQAPDALRYVRPDGRIRVALAKHERI